MTGTLVLTALLASIVMAAAAFLAERGMVALGKPARHVWLLAIAVMLAIPSLELITMTLSSGPPIARPETAQPLPRISSVARAATDRINDSNLRRMEHWFLWLWAAASTLAFVRLAFAARMLRHRSSDWQRGEIAGVPVEISPAFGPAVIGLIGPQIVVPRRIAQLSAEEQHLALAHELEHIAAKDQWLARAAALAVAAVPWNPVLWLAARRLRSAIEIDCDARVLRRAPNASAYASLVLNVATWRREMPAGSLALGENALQQLERRLLHMANVSQPRRRTVGFALLALAGLFTTYACATATRAEKPQPKVHVLEPIVTTAVSDAKPFLEFEVDKPVSLAYPGPAPRYPDSLRVAGIEGEVLAQFVVSETGLAEFSSLKILAATNDLFVHSIQATVPQMRFRPAEVKGVKVRQLVQQLFEFAIAH